MQRNPTASRTSGAIILGGIILIAVQGVSLWPWILVVLALSVLPTGYAAGGLPGALIPALWLIGLVIAITADQFALGLIVLVVLTVLLRKVVAARVKR